MEHRLWSVVLAAGKGRRLAPLTGGIPKQFWRPAGSSSLLDQTLDRLTPLTPAARTVIVVDQGHGAYVGGSTRLRDRGRIVFQPADRGTAAGVLFGLMPVLAADPGATVVLTPSDHGVGDGTAFVQGLSDAIRHVRSSGGIVLLGVEPSSASEDFGWITLHPEAREARARLIRPVAGFVEKPHASVARRLLASGAIWNTMVLVAQARDLLTLSAAHLPEITAMFVRAADIARDEHPGFFRGVYSVLPRADFSRHVLAPARDLLAYTWPASMGWSDLGTPERLGAWLTAGPNGSTVGSRMVGGGARPDSAATAVAT